MKSPSPPDPYKTAQAQAASNKETAIANQELNMVNQVGPWGSISYNQTGVSASGTPIYTQTTNLSPSQKAIFQQSQKAQGNLAKIAAQQSSFLQDYLDKGLNVSGAPELASGYAGADDFSADRQRVEDALWDRMADDRMQAEEALRSKLTAQGIRPGSAAWDAEMERMAAQNTDARLATIAAAGAEQSRLVGLSRDAAAFNNSARDQYVQEAFALRNQPLNEISALLSGTQVSSPGSMYSATPGTQMAGVDVAGLIGQDYQNRLQASQGAMGGLFGLGGSTLGAAGNAGGFGALFSDERLKTDVEHVGYTHAGTPIYTYRYVWGGPVHMGVMAQDVPEAAEVHSSGFLTVDYGKVH